MDSNTRLKAIAAAALMAAYAALVFTGKVPASDFATLIRDALIGLGVFHVALTDPKEPK